VAPASVRDVAPAFGQQGIIMQPEEVKTELPKAYQLYIAHNKAMAASLMARTKIKDYEEKSSEQDQLKKLVDEEPNNFHAKLALGFFFFNKRNPIDSAESNADKKLAFSYISECAAANDFADNYIAIGALGHCYYHAYGVPAEDNSRYKIATRCFRRALFSGPEIPVFFHSVIRHNGILDTLDYIIAHRTDDDPATKFLALFTLYEYCNKNKDNPILKKRNAQQYIDKINRRDDFYKQFFLLLCQLHGWNEQEKISATDFAQKILVIWPDDKDKYSNALHLFFLINACCIDEETRSVRIAAVEALYAQCTSEHFTLEQAIIHIKGVAAGYLFMVQTTRVQDKAEQEKFAQRAIDLCYELLKMIDADNIKLLDGIKKLRDEAILEKALVLKNSPEKVIKHLARDNNNAVSNKLGHHYKELQFELVQAQPTLPRSSQVNDKSSSAVMATSGFIATGLNPRDPAPVLTLVPMVTVGNSLRQKYLSTYITFLIH